MITNIEDHSRVFASVEMKECIEEAKKIAVSAYGVLVYGEEGTEKDLIASIIHQYRHKDNQHALVSINCSFMPDDRFKEELFGNSNEEPGLLQLTGAGTIHLEDISELSLYAQSMLVDVMKNRSFRRTGECNDITISCRIIASSKKNLLQLASEGKYNFELFYLISVLPIYIPPLRKRKDDINTLAKSFLDEYNQSHIYNKKFLHPETLKLLQSYEWPGNTIELRNVMFRALHLSTQNAVKPKDITFINMNPKESMLISNSLRDQIESYEKNVVEQALRKYQSARKTADVLDVSHTTILKKIRKYGLESYII